MGDPRNDLFHPRVLDTGERSASRQLRTKPVMPARFDLPLIRRRDQKSVGTLTIVRANHPAFTDESGARRSNPVRVDQLLITLTDAAGKTVCYLELPMAQLPADEA